MFKIQLPFISFIVNLPPTYHSTPDYKTIWWHSRGIYGKPDIIVISNFLTLPLTFLEVAVFFTRETKAAKLQRKLFTQFIHSSLFFLKKTSHLTPGLGLCNLLGKRQIRQFLGVKIQLYMPKSHLRVDIVFQNNIGIKGSDLYVSHTMIPG